MDDITQIRIGKHMTGIIGLKAALAEAAASCKGMPDDQIGSALVKSLSMSNYIPGHLKEMYTLAFIREYKKHIGEPVPETPAEGLQVKVLGPGCPQCERLEQELMAAMAETGILAELDHVRDIKEIGRYGVMGTPALVIDGEVKSVGTVPSRTKLKAWIETAAKKQRP